MKVRRTMMLGSEQAYHEALRATRKAIRAGELAQAERWMKLADRYFRTTQASWAASQERADKLRAWKARAEAEAKREPQDRAPDLSGRRGVRYRARTG
jgi:hypothetical protein